MVAEQPLLEPHVRFGLEPPADPAAPSVLVRADLGVAWPFLVAEGQAGPRVAVARERAEFFDDPLCRFASAAQRAAFRAYARSLAVAKGVL
jgi:hypothetical protein